MKQFLSLSLVGVACAFGAPAFAAECPRGALDAKFCDVDDDMVADAPTDPKQWVDPGTLIFAYTPVEDPEVYRGVWDEFLRHMEKVTGKKVQFFPVQSNAAQLEAMRSGRLHVAGFNTGSNPLAVNCAGFVPFTMMADKQGVYGYEMEIIVPAASPVQSIEELKGKTIAFTSQTSNSGYKAPSALLASNYGMQADKDYKTAFSGKHDNSIIGVANDDYDAAAVANSVLNRMVARNAVDSAKLRSIYKSQSFPTTGYGYVYNLEPGLAAKVKDAFFTFDWEGSALLKEFGKSEPAQEAFIPITYKEHWAVVRGIDQAMNVSYACQ
ncbi:phosphate/phosphite/phosphonate ABC transporter substrate-binding protein [Verticiella sediminum]|uniref:Phosphate/phosphite/phosphonate ABC transporter substrate-binding protein n=1 Tax=Verticiella sediminum TaxID=1247510 RepID=A0A556AS58_9BURK|nr:phosphate/phosphite/phosphonate ABC transporter substrate-binding protein [Verticiella sediminum]TSH95756.1 phosphate/phosphite/phosphonate ABC transporter substrate-binding protein [Verticiella sediminum]